MEGPAVRRTPNKFRRTSGHPNKLVIPTEAKRSGGTCCTPDTQTNSSPPPDTQTNLSSRPKRSVVEGPTVRRTPNKFLPTSGHPNKVVIPTEAKRSGGTRCTPDTKQIPPNLRTPKQTCHPDRSEAQWRDLLYAGHPGKFLPTSGHPNKLVILTEAKRSGGTCCTPDTNQIPPDLRTPKQTCHPDRSEAQWRNLLYAGHPGKFLPTSGHPNKTCHPDRREA